MKPFRKNLAIAVDGGGIRGVVVTKALTMLEESLGQPIHELTRLYAGTSTGAIISTALAAKLSASQIHDLYVNLGETVFRKSWRTLLFPLGRYRYSYKPLDEALHDALGDIRMKDLWHDLRLTDMVITTFDVLSSKTLFIKPWKLQYQDWPLRHAALASSSVPTYFPPIDGRYIDGGVGSYANPCYLAAYELNFCLGWKPEETTLLSFGTGRPPSAFKPGEPERAQAWTWIEPLVDAVIASTTDQQVRLVETFFKKLDFRRFQVDLRDNVEMDDVGRIPELVEYGRQLGEMVLSDRVDCAMRVKPSTPGQEAG
ncbi:MAG TPA: patatin-like phospholipase family protein [Anaerolineales bacterium]|nr:patatin-like phospholipase family protein [Anaerolineales bacterium]